MSKEINVFKTDMFGEKKVFYYSKKRRISSLRGDNEAYCIVEEDGKYRILTCSLSWLVELYPPTHNKVGVHKKKYGEHINHFR